MSKELLKNIESHLQDEKSKIAISNIVAVLDAKRDAVLPKVLEEILEKVKNNPLAEKEIKKKQDEIQEMMLQGELEGDEPAIELLDAVSTPEELGKLHEAGITLAEFVKLGTEINIKVFSHKYLDENENYVFKEPPSHKEMKVLSFHESKEVRKQGKKVRAEANKVILKYQEARSISENGKTDADAATEKIKSLTQEIKEMQEDTKSVSEALNEMALKYSGLDKNSMTEWEQNLAISKVIAMAEGSYTPPMGKS